MNELAGSLTLRPGARVPNSLRSTRKAWASTLAPGTPALALPGLMGALFSLCGHAHRSASALAIDALGVGTGWPAEGLARALQRETAREHVRRIALDWPRLLARPDRVERVAAQALAGLRECPLLRSGTSASGPSAGDGAAMLQWLKTHWLQVDASSWLQAWDRAGDDWLADWTRRSAAGPRPWLPDLLGGARAWDCPMPATEVVDLPLPDDGPSWQRFADALGQDERLLRHPRWQGRCARTGTWTRHHLPARALPPTAWGLLGTRLAELVRLCLPDAAGATGNGWLAWGSRQTGPHRALAWVEMARGLLVHQVTLETASDGSAPRVVACEVLAPTDWNFHPEGVAAQALAQLPADAPDVAARVRMLMAALDPCVPFECVLPFEVAATVGQRSREPANA